MPGTCNYGMLQGERHSADAIKVVTVVGNQKKVGSQRNLSEVGLNVPARRRIHG